MDRWTSPAPWGTDATSAMYLRNETIRWHITKKLERVSLLSTTLCGSFRSTEATWQFSTCARHAPVVERVPQMALSMLLCSAGFDRQVTVPQRFIAG
jgi:hypothetical protein